MFDKECLPNAVKTRFFGLCVHGHQFGLPLPPQKKITQGAVALLTFYQPWFNILYIHTHMETKNSSMV